MRSLFDSTLQDEENEPKNRQFGPANLEISAEAKVCPDCVLCYFLLLLLLLFFFFFLLQRVSLHATTGQHPFSSLLLRGRHLCFTPACPAVTTSATGLQQLFAPHPCAAACPVLGLFLHCSTSSFAHSACCFLLRHALLLYLALLLQASNLHAALPSLPLLLSSSAATSPLRSAPQRCSLLQPAASLLPTLHLLPFICSPSRCHGQRLLLLHSASHSASPMSWPCAPPFQPALAPPCAAAPPIFFSFSSSLSCHSFS